MQTRFAAGRRRHRPVSISQENGKAQNQGDSGKTHAAGKVRLAACKSKGPLKPKLLGSLAAQRLAVELPAIPSAAPDELVAVNLDVGEIRLQVFNKTQAVCPVPSSRLQVRIKAGEITVHVADKKLSDVLAHH